MEYKDLELADVQGGLYDFLDELTDLFDKYCVYEVKKCDDGILLIGDEGKLIFDHYDEGVITGLKVQTEYHSYYTYGDKEDNLPHPRVLNKTEEEENMNTENLEKWYDGELEKQGIHTEYYEDGYKRHYTDEDVKRRESYNDVDNADEE